MGSNQSQDEIKSKRKDPLQFLFNNNKKQIIFSKLSQKTLSLISSFLSIQEYHNILLISKGTYQLFIQTSGCFQIECHRLLNIKGDQIISQNWKKIIQSLRFIPIKGIPFNGAIKSVRQQLKQFPIIIEEKVNYSGFQKAILYFQNKRNVNNLSSSYQDYQELLQFARKNQDLVLKLRQGMEIYIQLPQLLMQIYTLHDYIKIYSLYLEIKLQKCNLQQFIQMWQHYTGWISILEQETAGLIATFNNIIDATFPNHKLPNYSVRQFMVSQWLKKSEKGEIIVMLREEFRLKMIESRNNNIKFQELREYVQYLIDISTNQINIHQYGQYNFEYCQELNKLINLAVDLSPLLSIDYQNDENILINIFGQYIYDYYIFEFLSSFRIEQFKKQIRQYQQNSQKMTKIVKNIDEQQSIFSSHHLDNQTQKFEHHLSIHYNVQVQIRSLFKQISLPDDDSCLMSDNLQPESLEASSISFASTNCSSIFSSIKNNDYLYHYVKTNQQQFFNKIQLYFQRQQTINQQQSDIDTNNNYTYDIPELGQYQELQFSQIWDLIQNKVQEFNPTTLSERRQKISSIFNQELNQQQICTKELSQAEQLLINILK